ncbi:MAG: hypothetical protein L0I18_07250, partial [Lactobacillus sp.]|nr:hypothetical protein [Lactobacillus sp.]
SWQIALLSNSPILHVRGSLQATDLSKSLMFFVTVGGMYLLPNISLIYHCYAQNPIFTRILLGKLGWFLVTHKPQRVQTSLDISTGINVVALSYPPRG